MSTDDRRWMTLPEWSHNHLCYPNSPCAHGRWLSIHLAWVRTHCIAAVFDPDKPECPVCQDDAHFLRLPCPTRPSRLIELDDA